MNRRSFLIGMLAALSVAPEEITARTTRNKRSRRRRRQKRWNGPSFPSSIPTTNDGDCSCGSGRVCVGPRGGGYCITRSGEKRYGV